MTPDDKDLADREIVITRVVDAPRELVWQAWTQPEHLIQWWGPDGFTNTFHSYDFREGGVWDYMMHGPDGVDYPNWIRFEKIVQFERIEYLHASNAQHADGFFGCATFEDHHRKTQVTLRLTLPTAEERERVANAGAIEGGKQTLRRLAVYVEAM
jgi:uncharacterized protein YndB with AHSA1/START domain